MPLPAPSTLNRWRVARGVIARSLPSIPFTSATAATVLMSRTAPYRSLRRQSRPWRGDRLGLRWIGLIVRSRIELRRRNGGFSLIVIFLLVLSVLTTTLALTSRTTGGLYAQSYQGKLRVAKDAAENGLTIVASEFNYPGNRLFLGGASVNKINSPGGLDPNILLWDSKVIPADVNAGLNPDDQPCYIYSLSTGNNSANDGGGAIRQALSGANVDVKDKNIIYKPSVVQNPVSRKYDGENNTSWFDSISRNPNDFHYLGNGQFYRIIALRLYNSDHTENSSDAPIYAKAEKDQVSYLTVAVEGVYNYQLGLGRAPSALAQRGRIEAQGSSFVNYANSVRYTMQQEFQVVPRCCSQGFGKVNGIDYGPITATADSSNCTAATPKPNTQTEWILRSVSRRSAFNRLP